MPNTESGACVKAQDFTLTYFKKYPKMYLKVRFVHQSIKKTFLKIGNNSA